MRSRTQLLTHKRMKSGPRKLTAYEKLWQEAVLSLKFCVRCGAFGVQWAHRNQGKGTRLKTHPSQTAALCPVCHHEIDNGKSLSLIERRSIMDDAINETHERLKLIGRLPPPEEALCQEK